MKPASTGAVFRSGPAGTKHGCRAADAAQGCDVSGARKIVPARSREASAGRASFAYFPCRVTRKVGRRKAKYRPSNYLATPASTAVSRVRNHQLRMEMLPISLSRTVTDVVKLHSNRDSRFVINLGGTPPHGAIRTGGLAERHALPLLSRKLRLHFLATGHPWPYAGEHWRHCAIRPAGARQGLSSCRLGTGCSDSQP